MLSITGDAVPLAVYFATVATILARVQALLGTPAGTATAWA